ncbi:Thermolabile hemolysin [Grifola frondosa]|uniref:Thermolabile hemolysin n=1 Tax=Grifola frondosa TaxID=5627 RepID=A0A1C7MEW8_GRIFR|nr:Thermolabile hemolysin [Grifola frondosa]
MNSIGPSWRGFPNLKYLVIFGDSYSDVGYNATMSAHPTGDQPFGIEFPGITWAEPGMPNWVGHLVTEYSLHTHLLVYDYAVGGDTVSGVRKQVQVKFLPHVGAKPHWAPWVASNTLFVTWVGINDCAWGDETIVKNSVMSLFGEQETLYNAGARNFLFIDVPPINRTPIGYQISKHELDSGRIYETWNTLLRESIVQFSSTHHDITTFLFSSWDTFTRVLDDPMAHGFPPDDATLQHSSIWFDHLHPSSKMHDWIAHDVAKFLEAQPPYNECCDTCQCGMRLKRRIEYVNLVEVCSMKVFGDHVVAQGHHQRV